MGVLYSIFAFPKIHCTYDYSLPHLKFVTRSDGCFIPIYHFVLDDQLPTLLMCHGNSSCLAQYNVEKIAQRYHCNICQFDYSGRGMHTSKDMNEEECQKDVLTVYHYLTKCHIQNIYVLGFSIGTYFATYLVSQVKNVSGLILVSSFQSVTKTITNLSLIGDFCKTEKLAPCITCPTLFIHGCHDYLCPIKQSIAMSKDFPNVYDFCIVDCAHHKMMENRDCIDAVNDFIHNND